MSNNMQSNAEYAAGATKETAGNVTGSDNLKAQGRTQKEEGNARYQSTNTEANKGPSKITGQLHAAKGAVKETLGSILKNDSLEQSGANERRTGNREVEAAKSQNVAQGAAGQVKGNVKENVGYVTGNPQKEAEGRGENIKGQAQYNANQ
ncbi:hypothetical protein C1645_790415 [Glomus cerebriforme]|uniref:CsbD-like domain-containing protein n=1 Tax=Glomus cerebriforme TaxID=658196 RepID=A0A397S574_9GLOM|nr:hypothetical protein C1645_791095 [Glomus cerebriforme]RIA81468.1 hypothetical protein C1645_790415 [Glomus cerebriforme]